MIAPILDPAYPGTGAGTHYGGSSFDGVAGGLSRSGPGRDRIRGRDRSRRGARHRLRPRERQALEPAQPGVGHVRAAVRVREHDLRLVRDRVRAELVELGDRGRRGRAARLADLRRRGDSGPEDGHEQRGDERRLLRRPRAPARVADQPADRPRVLRDPRLDLGPDDHQRVPPHLRQRHRRRGPVDRDGRGVPDLVRPRDLWARDAGGELQVHRHRQRAGLHRCRARPVRQVPRRARCPRPSCCSATTGPRGS